jgi:outer membrane lipoprotein-sorting protein
MSYFLRRLPLSRLLLLCGVLVGVGVSATALATALGTGPTPPPKPLADAIHDALTAGAGGNQIQGVSAQIQLTNHLLEGANLASGDGEASQLTSSPLLSGASGRLWVSKDGHARLELQSEKGDTQIYYDGHTVSIYDAATNTLYRYTPPKEGEWGSGSGASGGEGGASLGNGASGGEGGGGSGNGGSGGEGGRGSGNGASGGEGGRGSGNGASGGEGGRGSGNGASGGEGGASSSGGASGWSASNHEIPSVAKIEEAISHLSKHATVSGATPTDIAGQAAYTVRVSPNEPGSLLAGAELSWDAVNGVPLRAAIYSTESSSPALELAATSISYGPVEPSVFEFAPPTNAKVEEVVLPKRGEQRGGSAQGGEHEHPNVTTHGHGPGTIAVLEGKAGHTAGTAGSGVSSPSSSLPEGLQQVKIDGTTASELPTELGTLLTFERAGVRYLIAGAVVPSAVEAVAKGQ